MVYDNFDSCKVAGSCVCATKVMYTDLTFFFRSGSEAQTVLSSGLRFQAEFLIVMQLQIVREVLTTPLANYSHIILKPYQL